MKSTGLVLSLLAAFAACGSEGAFDPDLVDLTGNWLFYETTYAHNPPPELTSNECRVLDVPLNIVRDPDNDRWWGTVTSGGTMQCELNGEWGDRVTYEPPGYLLAAPLLITKAGSEVNMMVGGGFDFLNSGRLESADRMSGAVNPSQRGREGIWLARRRR